MLDKKHIVFKSSINRSLGITVLLLGAMCISCGCRFSASAFAHKVPRSRAGTFLGAEIVGLSLARQSL